MRSRSRPPGRAGAKRYRPALCNGAAIYRHDTRPGRGISAEYLVDQIESDFDQWIDDGGGAVGGGGDVSPNGSEGFDSIDGYQLTVWGKLLR